MCAPKVGPKVPVPLAAPGFTTFLIPVSSIIEATTKMLALSRTPGLKAINVIGLRLWEYKSEPHLLRNLYGLVTCRVILILFVLRRGMSISISRKRHKGFWHTSTIKNHD